MTLPPAIQDVVTDWGSYYANHAVLRTFVAFAHVGGLVAGGGAAIVADRAILAGVSRNDVERRLLLTSVRDTHAVVRWGLLVVIVSGVLLFAADVDTYLASQLFWTKMALVVLLMINGAALTSAERRFSWEILRWTAIASLTLWMLTTLIGVALPNAG